MRKDKAQGKTIRSTNYEVLSGRKTSAHKQKHEKRTKCKLRREMESNYE